MGRVHPVLLVLTLAGVACAPATLGSGDPSGTGGHAATTEPQPPPVTSCAGGTVEASGATADGIFLATAVTVRGTACRDWSSAAVNIAGNHAAVYAISIPLRADYLDGDGLRLPLGEQAVVAGISGRQGKAIVVVTAADDAFFSSGSPTSHLEASFEVYDGDLVVSGKLSAPFCYVGPCPPEGG